MSFKDIGKIIRRIDGRANDDVNINISNKSNTPHTLHLYNSDMTPIEVAIAFAISASEEDIVQEYWVLN
ncbi:MAG: hypothetical protein ACRD8Z_24625, partial [Nitrososphaeraceae archaeon]